MFFFMKLVPLCMVPSCCPNGQDSLISKPFELKCGLMDKTIQCILSPKDVYSYQDTCGDTQDLMRARSGKQTPLTTRPNHLSQHIIQDQLGFVDPYNFPLDLTMEIRLMIASRDIFVRMSCVSFKHTCVHTMMHAQVCIFINIRA